MDHQHHHQDQITQQKPYKDHEYDHHHLQHLSPSMNKKRQPQTVDRSSSSSKRDEWSEGAVTALLEAYESKWALRNRAKLKAQDWEDVARQVSGRADHNKPAKTQTQCKNKIESMKKRYRSESAADVAASPSSWPLYHRLDGLLRGYVNNGGGGGSSGNNCNAASCADGNNVITSCGKGDDVAASPVNLLVLEQLESGGGGGGDHLELGKENNNNEIITPRPTNISEPEKNIGIDETDSISTRTQSKAKTERTNKNNSNYRVNKRRSSSREKNNIIGESVRWVAEALIRSEQARMEKMKEIEKMRAEAEAKRGEIDLKRTEIIANTQLEIARIVANVIKGSSSSNNSDDSSLKNIGRSR